MVVRISHIGHGKLNKHIDLSTCAVLVHLNRSVVELTQGLDLNVVAVCVNHSLAIQVRVEVFSHILLEKVGIFGLQETQVIEPFCRRMAYHRIRDFVNIC